MYLKKYKKGYSLINVMFVLMIAALISAYSYGIVINNKRSGVTFKYNDLYDLGELEEILPQVNLYLKNDNSGIKDRIQNGIPISISSTISIIYSRNFDKVQINYIYNGASKGRFFRYKYIGEHIILIPEEGKYE